MANDLDKFRNEIASTSAEISKLRRSAASLPCDINNASQILTNLYEQETEKTKFAELSCVNDILMINIKMFLEAESPYAGVEKNMGQVQRGRFPKLQFAVLAPESEISDDHTSMEPISNNGHGRENFALMLSKSFGQECALGQEQHQRAEPNSANYTYTTLCTTGAYRKLTRRSRMATTGRTGRLNSTPNVTEYDPTNISFSKNLFATDKNSKPNKHF
ncbi:hypothetical protein TKK_0001161 [Trichogramma kaykai]